MAIRFTKGGIQSYQTEFEKSKLGKAIISGGGSTPTIPTPSDSGQVEAERQAQELREQLNREQAKQIAEANKNYQNELRNLRSQAERQKALEKLNKNIQNIQRATDIKKLESGVIKSKTYVSGGYMEQGKYIPRSETKVGLSDIGQQAQEINQIINKPYGVVSPAQTTIQRLKGYYVKEGDTKLGTILSIPSRTIKAISEELARAEDIRQQKTRDFYQSQASIEAVKLAPQSLYFTPLAPTILVSSGAEKLITKSGQEQIQQNILGMQEKGYGKITSNVIGYGVPVAEVTGGLLGLRSQGRGYLEAKRLVNKLSNEMIIKEDKLLAKNLKERLERLKALDKRASELGLNVPSAYEEAVNVGKIDYLGTGKKVLSKTDITQLTKTAKELGILKTSKEGKRVIEDTGVYKLPYKVVPPKEIELVRGITESGKPAWTETISFKNLKYTPRYTQQGEIIGTGTFKTRGKETLGVGFTGEMGKRGLINKNLFVYQQKGKIGRFDIIEQGRKSTRYIPTEAGKLKLEIYPFGRRVETQLVKTKTLGQQKIDNKIVRVYESEYGLTPTKTRRIYRAETPRNLGEIPTTKEFKESLKLSKDLTIDVIEKKPVRLDYYGSGEIKTTGKNILGVYKEVKKINLPYTQKAVTIRLPKGADIMKSGDFSNIILTSGKKSSEQYLKSLYQKPIVLPRVERIIKISKPIKKPIIKEIPTTEKTIYKSIYTGAGLYERYKPSENIFITRTIEPTRLEGTLGESRIPSLTGMGISDLGVEGRYNDLGITTSGRLNLDLSTEQKTRNKTKTQEAENLFIGSGIGLGLQPSKRIKEEEKQKEKQRQKEELKIQQSQKQRLRIKQIMEELTKFKEQTKPKIAIPTITIPKTEKNILKKVSKEPEYFEVLGKRFGKEISLLKTPSKRKAEEETIRFLKGTLGRSARILESGKPLEFKELSLLKTKEFRPAKRESTRIVQEAKFSLGTKGETSEIQYFKRKGKRSIL